jgi:hypothetical protein
MHCGEQLAPVADRGHADDDQVVGLAQIPTWASADPLKG